ncbi:MAG: sodium:proton antiporter [Lachnospiraceae bacterium]|nr:sodium:proton antiporter [Lachnospiraceae bacterium]MBP5415183.1 sodium:proton antiporter [Lachnospiraceae bacterium]MBP5746029.1 sodium:proton antiporter [Lachnospiraceae bacterium]
MDIVCNFPAVSILLCLFGGIISSGLKQMAARIINAVLILTVIVLSATTFVYTLATGSSFVYVMGRFPAPWGNEIRAGMLETFMATFFGIIMLLSLLGGEKKLHDEVEEDKIFLYYVLNDLLLSSLLALVYTNDLFTAYVFIEINTIAACGLIMIRQNGRTIEAAVRYMIMSLLGSGMILLSICLLYDITGHLLMSNIKETIVSISHYDTYYIPLAVAIALICVGLAIKSALYPFHAWLPDAYGYSTVSSAAILSSLVSKGYIFLLIKIFYRVIGIEIIRDSKIINILFIFGLAGMIFGSLSAMKEGDIRRMIAFSSVAQIGYIYMGFGLGTQVGMIASIFHILTHAATKSLLFISAIGLTEVSGGSRHFNEATGSGYRNKIAGIGFTVGSLSMVGLPAFAGFISKILFAQAALKNSHKMLPVLIVLGISTILNAIYFLKTVIRIYTPVETSLYKPLTIKKQKLYSFVIAMFIMINFFLGLMSTRVIDWITMGLEMFS